MSPGRGCQTGAGGEGLSDICFLEHHEMFRMWRTQTFQEIMTEYGAGKTAFLSEENCRWSSGESSFEAQGPTPIPPGPAADLQTPGPSSAGAQGTFRWQEKQFFV